MPIFARGSGWSVKPRGNHKAFVKAQARGLIGFDELLAATRRFAEWANDIDPRFIKYPATWLNADSYLNEPDKPKGTTPEAKIAEPSSQARPTRKGPETPREQRQNPASGPFWKNDEKSSVGWSGQVRTCDPPGLVSPPTTPSRRSGLSPGRLGTCRTKLNSLSGGRRRAAASSGTG